MQPQLETLTALLTQGQAIVVQTYRPPIAKLPLVQKNYRPSFIRIPGQAC